MEKIRIEQHSFGGLIWFAGWLFTIGFLQLQFWKGVLAVLLWPVYSERLSVQCCEQSPSWGNNMAYPVSIRIEPQLHGKNRLTTAFRADSCDSACSSRRTRYTVVRTQQRPGLAVGRGVFSRHRQLVHHFVRTAHT